MSSSGPSAESPQTFITGWLEIDASSISFHIQQLDTPEQRGFILRMLLEHAIPRTLELSTRQELQSSLDSFEQGTGVPEAHAQSFLSSFISVFNSPLSTEVTAVRLACGFVAGVELQTTAFVTLISIRVLDHWYEIFDYPQDRDSRRQVNLAIRAIRKQNRQRQKQ